MLGSTLTRQAPPALVFVRTVWGDRAGDRERSEEGDDLTKSFGTRINGLELRRVIPHDARTHARVLVSKLLAAGRVLVSHALIAFELRCLREGLSAACSVVPRPGGARSREARDASLEVGPWRATQVIRALPLQLSSARKPFDLAAIFGPRLGRRWVLVA